MKRMIAIIGMIFVSSTWAFSGQAAEKTLDGRAWKQWSADWKLFYVLGYLEGIHDGVAVITLAQGKDEPTSEQIAYNVGQLFWGNSTRGEIIEALDFFYQDPANISVHTMFAMMYCACKKNGANMTVWEEALQKERRLMVKPPATATAPWERMQ
jgi:hypothetical protein